MGLISSKISDICEYLRHFNFSNHNTHLSSDNPYTNFSNSTQSLITPEKNIQNAEKFYDTMSTSTKLGISTVEDDFQNKIYLKDFHSVQNVELLIKNSRNKNSNLKLSKFNTYPHPEEKVKNYSLIVQKEKFIKSGIKLEDFEILKVLGRGSFGKVLLVKYKEKLNYYAMKVLKKERLFKTNQISHTKTEKEILEKVDHPFLVKLYYAFQNEVKLYLVTEFMQGGELFFHLRNEKKFSESRARIYACEIILALEYLHSNNIIYRDLKPENILLDADGHIKLTDFGLSKFMYGRKTSSANSTLSLNLSEVGDDKAFTICGTPEYLAPEILVGKGYSKSVDWWSLGILLFEMLTGSSPYKFKKEKRVNFSIYTIPINLDDYAEISDEAKNLINLFLKPDPSERLCEPSLIKSHAFFNGINWTHVERKFYQPEFVPGKHFNSIEDLCFFDKKYVKDSFSSDEEIKNKILKNINSDDKFYRRKYRKYHDFDNFSFDRDDVQDAL